MIGTNKLMFEFFAKALGFTIRFPQRDKVASVRDASSCLRPGTLRLCDGPQKYHPKVSIDRKSVV